MLISLFTVDLLLLVAATSLTLRSYPLWYAMAGMTAVSPDLAWVYRFIVRERLGKVPPQPSNFFNEWHSRIQKLESRWGLIPEAGYLLTLWLTAFMWL